MSLSEVGAVLVEAAAELQSVSELDATRIVFLGGSLGGGGVLATLSHPEFNRHPPSAVIALYPSCVNLPS